MLVRGEMKKIGLILAAFLGWTSAGYAADLPVKATPPADYHWSGCFFGDSRDSDAEGAMSPLARSERQ